MGKKFSGNTHSKDQHDNWANQNNPNNKAYIADDDSHSNRLNFKHRTHRQIHNGRRRNKYCQTWADWAPDYIEYDD